MQNKHALPNKAIILAIPVPDLLAGFLATATATILLAATCPSAYHCYHHIREIATTEAAILLLLVATDHILADIAITTGGATTEQLSSDCCHYTAFL